MGTIVHRRYTHTVQKVKHSCSYCGFEPVLFESNAVGIAGYECPICGIGTLSKASDVIVVGPSEVKHGT